MAIRFFEQKYAAKRVSLFAHLRSAYSIHVRPLHSMLCIHNIHTRVCFNVFGSFGGLTERPRIVIESPFPTWKKKCRQTKAKSNNSGPIITIRELPLCECLSGYLPASLYIRYVSRPHAAAAATGKISRQKNSFFSFFSFLLFPNLFYCQHFK